MKRMNFRKTLVVAVMMGGAIAAGSALADSRGVNGSGYGMGPGMMGYGSGQNMGPGMMGSGSGYNMGPGMMDSGSGYGMGPGMMNGYGSQSDLNLTSEQRGKIAKIQDGVRRKHWDLMGKMQDEQSQMNEQFSSDKRDNAALSKSYQRMSDMRREMFDLSLNAQDQIDAVLTKEQREKQKHG
jgi:Spy/CpxP family protein refolding chaperone